MKQLLAVLCALVLCMSVAVLSASADAQTAIDASSGDEITYQLTLSNTDDPVVGCDMSVYYDPSALEIVSVADFNDKTSGYSSVINADSDGSGEVIQVFSILDGVDFSSGRNLITVTFRAKSDTTSHVSYYVRDLYPDDLQPLSPYTFTCTVLKNGQTYVENAQPELNTTTEQTRGHFVNSLSGDSNDAGVNTNINVNAGNAVNGGEANENAVESQGSTNYNTPGEKNAGTSSIVATDKDGNVLTDGALIATADDAATSSGGPSVWVWIIVGVIVLGAGGGIAAYVVKKKKSVPTDTVE